MGSGGSKAPKEVKAPNAIKAKAKEPTAAPAEKGASGATADIGSGYSENYTDEFKTMCGNIFGIADLNNDGKLDYNEFHAAFSSKTLSLGLSDTEMRTLMEVADRDGDSVVTLSEFTYLVKNLKKILADVYDVCAETDDANDWCYVQDPELGKTVYLNKRTGETTSKKPSGFSKERVEPIEFEYFNLDDGTEISIHTGEDGVRMYMDWDLGSWTKVPQEWNEMIDEQQDTVVDDDSFASRSKKRQSIAGTDSNPLTHAKQANSKAGQTTVTKKNTEDDARDERMGVFEHHSKGLFHTFLFENQRNTRLFFDETDGQWVRMPLSWERNIPEIQTMLAEIDSQLPHWKNVNEQLLSLRECNYEVADTIAFGEINFGFEQEEKSDKLGDNILRTARRRTTTHKSTALIGVEGDSGLGKLSAKVAKHISDLEQALAAAQKKIDEAEEKEDELGQEVRQFKRRATQMGTLIANKGNTDAADEKRHRELTGKVNDQRLKILDLEKQLAESLAGVGAASASDDEAADLRKQLAEKSTALAMLKAEAEKYSDAQMAAIHAQSKELVRIKTELGSVQADFNEMEDMFTEVTKVAKKIGENTQQQVQSITSKYRAEVVLRKQLYNKIQELKGNIRVFLRCRPDSSVKAEDNVMRFPTELEVIIPSLKGDDITMEFNQTYGPNTTQEGIFGLTKPVVMSVVDGYNVCIMAYGQTGSGKTYTMMGPKENPGVNRRTIKELIDLVTSESETLEVSIHAGMFEVYNENVYDLLAPEGRTKRDVKLGPNGIYLPGLTERPCQTPDDVVSVMDDGQKNRSMAATKMNSESSRSHLIFEIRVDTFNKMSKVHTEGKLALVDLAGSERVGKSGVTGAGLAEAAAINKSLSALSQVFAGLGKNSPHIPYRNSKLTHVLQEYLGGDAKCCVFVNVRPDRSNLSETLSTMNFGQNIKKIELGPAKAKKGKKPPPPK